MEFQFVSLMLLATFTACDGAPNYDVDFSEVHWEGGFALFPVKRDAVQQRLNEFNSQAGEKDVKLYLPSKCLVEDITGSEENHVVMIAFGTGTAVEFDKALTDKQKKSRSTIVRGIWINIPYLSTTDGGQPKITLQMKSYHEDADETIQVNAILPTPIIADSLTQDMSGDNIDIRFELNCGNLQLNLTGNHSEPCTFPGTEVLEDVDEYEHELQISQNGPNFDICDLFPDLDVSYCNVPRNTTYKEILKEAGSNVCQYWKPKPNVESCKASVQIGGMSDEMRALLLLEDETQEAIEAEIQTGNYDIRLVFPCIE